MRFFCVRKTFYIFRSKKAAQVFSDPRRFFLFRNRPRKRSNGDYRPCVSLPILHCFLALRFFGVFLRELEKAHCYFKSAFLFRARPRKRTNRKRRPRVSLAVFNRRFPFRLLLVLFQGFLGNLQGVPRLLVQSQGL